MKLFVMLMCIATIFAITLIMVIILINNNPPIY